MHSPVQPFPIHSFAQAKIAKISAWNNAACAPLKKDIHIPGLTLHTPVPDQPALLDLSAYQASPLDWTVIGQITNQCFHDRITILKKHPKAVIGIILSWLICSSQLVPSHGRSRYQLEKSLHLMSANRILLQFLTMKFQNNWIILYAYILDMFVVWKIFNKMKVLPLWSPL
jgi:hypothetical protein